MATTPKIGRPKLPKGERMTAQIPATRCLKATRKKFDQLGGADWLREAVDRDHTRKFGKDAT